MSQKEVTIGGVKYDAHTGLRLEGPANTKTPRTSASTSANVHQKAQRTKTLKRSHVKSPVVTKPKQTAKTAKPAQAVHQAHTRSPMIRKFASNDITPVRKRTPQSQQKKPDAPAPTHPVHQAASAAIAAKKPAEVKHKAPAEAKKHEVTKALAKSKPAKKHKKQSIFARHPRLFSIATVGLVIVLLAGYVTYVNLPYLSVKIAAMQAGVRADYPSYQPAGYTLKGPVEYTPGNVTMRFTSNTSSESFTITQAKSDWDSSSLLENFVSKEAGDDYITITENGLTIYRYGTNAAWVNGGILHTIKGDAQLSDIQIRRLAASM